MNLRWWHELLMLCYSWMSTTLSIMFWVVSWWYWLLVMHWWSITDHHFRLPEIIQIHRSIVELMWRCSTHGQLLMPMIVRQGHLAIYWMVLLIHTVLHLTLHLEIGCRILTLHKRTWPSSLSCQLRVVFE
jgi:hypothetical protein